MQAENIGKIIAKAREEKGWEQKTLAIELKVTEAYVSLLEGGRAVPAIPRAKRIETILSMTQGTLTSMVLKYRLQNRISKLLAEGRSHGLDVEASLAVSVNPSEQHGGRLSK